MQRYHLFSCLVWAAVMMIAPAPSHADPQSTIKKMEQWLVNTRDHRTGIPVSHIGDPALANWTFTYDAAVTALAYLALDRVADAKKIIDFYMATREAWRLKGIMSAINPTKPELGAEWSVVAGPNIWMGVAAFHVYKTTYDTRYLAFAKKLADFIIYLQNTTPGDHNFGGIRMGPLGDPNVRGDQHLHNKDYNPLLYDTYATEHAIDAYVLFNFLEQETGLLEYATGRAQVTEWLRTVAFDPADKTLARGCREQIDPAFATDVYSWAISALGPQHLDTWEPDLAFDFIRHIEEQALITVEYTKPTQETVALKGVDFTDQSTVAALGRLPMVSPEWTFQLINAYRRIENVLRAKQDVAAAEIYATKRTRLLNNILALGTETPQGLAFPYATEGSAPVGHGFNTPRPGSFSTIAVAYGILALKGHDPLEPVRE